MSSSATRLSPSHSIPDSHWIEHTPFCTWQHLTQPSPPFHLTSKPSPAKRRTGTVSHRCSSLTSHPPHSPNQQPIPDALLIRCTRSLSTSQALALLLALLALLALRPPLTHDVLLLQCSASQSGAPTASPPGASSPASVSHLVHHPAGEPETPVRAPVLSPPSTHQSSASTQPPITPRFDGRYQLSCCCCRVHGLSH